MIMMPLCLYHIINQGVKVQPPLDDQVPPPLPSWQRTGSHRRQQQRHSKVQEGTLRTSHIVHFTWRGYQLGLFIYLFFAFVLNSNGPGAPWSIDTCDTFDTAKPDAWQLSWEVSHTRALPCNYRCRHMFRPHPLLPATSVNTPYIGWTSLLTNSINGCNSGNCIFFFFHWVTASIKAFKAHTGNLVVLVHTVQICVWKKVLEKSKAWMLQKSGKKTMMSHECQVTNLKPTTIALINISVGSSMCWRCFSFPLVQFWRKKSLKVGVSVLLHFIQIAFGTISSHSFTVGVMRIQKI